MPTYTYKCQECDLEQEAFRKMADYMDCPHCEDCGNMTKKIITPVNIGAYSTKVMEPYLSPASGKPINTNRARKRDMEDNGCRPWEGIKAEKQEVARKKKYSDEKLDKAVDTSLEKQIAQMPSEKRKRLGL